ncbi:hypothetical protein CFBP6411_05459 [Pseudomonas syringae group genomosp. 3]|uniref:Uncharacterized protein n=1 Tax=Pseudomonas syringae group genomosp. 3 TaxID=251701 RepID=A0A2K4WLN9_9PSED|nr:hypothetical protein CFBP6411_05459 [Pseudomonas syringae group genomosp. 3]
MNNVSADMDYQETIRAAAQAFIERHQGEHLGDLGQLLTRTADHLVESFEVKESFANHLVCRLKINFSHACVLIAARARCILFKISSPLAFQT